MMKIIAFTGAGISKQSNIPTFMERPDVREKLFRSYAEKHHEERYLKLLAALEAGNTFKRETPVVWKCNNCGFIFEGLEAPERCPACDHPQAHFEVNTFFLG